MSDRITRHNPEAAIRRLHRPPSTVSIRQVAKICDVDDETVRKWYRRQWIYPVRVGRQVRVPGTEMRRILAVRQMLRDRLINPKLGDALRDIALGRLHM